MRREIFFWNLAHGVIICFSILKGVNVSPGVHIKYADSEGMSENKKQLLDMIIADDCKGVFMYKRMHQQKQIDAAKAACQAMFKKLQSLDLWEQDPCLHPASADCWPVREGFPCIGGKTVHRCAVKITSPFPINHEETRSLKSCFKQEVKDRKKEKLLASSSQPQSKPTGTNVASTSGVGRGKGQGPKGPASSSRPQPKSQLKPTGSNIASTSGVVKGRAQTPKPKGPAQPKPKGPAQQKPTGQGQTKTKGTKSPGPKRT